jgi:hypothetical protein
VIAHDLLNNRKAKPGAIRLSKRDEWLKEIGANLVGNS